MTIWIPIFVRAFRIIEDHPGARQEGNTYSLVSPKPTYGGNRLKKVLRAR